jgi:plasmid maintenance system antidote protein VapI
MTEVAIISNMATKHIAPRGYIYVKEWMNHLDVSDIEMARRLGINRSAVWKQYSEQKRLDTDKIARIAAALDLHPFQLNYPPGVESLDALADDVEEKRRREIVEIVKTLTGKSKPAEK